MSQMEKTVEENSILPSAFKSPVSVIWNISQDCSLECKKSDNLDIRDEISDNEAVEIARQFMEEDVVKIGRAHV